MTRVPQYPVISGGFPAADLDPLDVDGVLPSMWRMNAGADANALVGLLRDLVPVRDFIAGLSLPGCVAAMRDLGLLLGSIKRCGVEPVHAVPELETPLRKLGARTGMVPRDTVFHYVGWNPTGARERMYTGNHMERLLISSVRVALPRLIHAVEQCGRLDTLDPDDPKFTAAANELATLIGSLKDSIEVVIGNVSPEFFAQTMRPYFEAVRIGEAEYLGPAAAHVPLYLVDLALWASERDSEPYREFWRESARYGLPEWQPLYRRWLKNPPLVTRVASALALAGDRQASPYLYASAEALCRALRALVVFRGKHLRVAGEAYTEDIRRYPLGSGGGSLQLLKEIAILTRDNVSSLRSSLAAGNFRCSSDPPSVRTAQLPTNVE